MNIPASQTHAYSRSQASAAPTRPAAAQGPTGPRPSDAVPGSATEGQDTAVPAGDPETLDVAQSLDRLDAYTESLVDRLRGAVSGSSTEEMDALEEVVGLIDHSLGRIRAGIEDGTLTAEDIQRGTGILFSMATERMEAARPAPDASEAGEGQDASDAVDTMAPPAPPAAGARLGEGDGAEDPAQDAADTDARVPADAEAATFTAAEAGSRFALELLSNLGTDLQSLLGDGALNLRAGSLYGQGTGTESITPRASGLDLSV